MSGQIRLDVEDQLQAFCRRLATDQAAHIVEDLVEIEVDRLHVHLACFDLRKIENVVDDAEQMLARPVDLLHVVRLLRIQVGAQSQVRHADDGVHRCADLV